MLHKTVYKFKAIPIKIPMMFRTTRINISKIYMEQQVPHCNSHHEKEEQSWWNHST